MALKTPPPPPPPPHTYQSDIKANWELVSTSPYAGSNGGHELYVVTRRLKPLCNN